MRSAIDRSRQAAADLLKEIAPNRTRRSLLRLRFRARRPTSRYRMLPNLLIIGAQRSGTSSLYKYLGRHPDVAPSLRKETGYFSDAYSEGLSWYLTHFPLTYRRAWHESRELPFVTFESTPDYMLDPRAPQRASELVPEAKIIAILREPASRAYSHYQHNVRLGLEPLSFEGALESEPTRIASDLDAIRQGDSTHRAVALRRFSYLHRGLYADQLGRWFDSYPREGVMILSSRTLFDQPETTFRHILDFLGIRPWLPARFGNYSYVATAPDTAPIPERTREHLARIFHEPNQRLEALLGHQLEWMPEGS